MSTDNNFDVLTTIITALKGLDSDVQIRILKSVATFLDISLSPSNLNKLNNIPVGQYKDEPITSKEVLFSENRDISPKDFMRDKSPQTDTERIVCLAYYLTHYRNLPHFKTVDLSSLNTEAAQPKFSNPTVSTDNAARAGLLVQAIKGTKQISAIGELFVQTLPDRDAARATLANTRRKRTKKPVSKKKQSELKDNLQNAK